MTSGGRLGRHVNDARGLSRRGRCGGLVWTLERRTDHRAGGGVDDDSSGAGGAGGGAGFVEAGATGATHTAGTNSDPDGNGSITISWTPGAGCAAPVIVPERITFTG